MTKASDGELCDDVVCVAQRLIMEVRKAAAAEGRNTSMPKAGKRSFHVVPTSKRLQVILREMRFSENDIVAKSVLTLSLFH